MPGTRDDDRIFIFLNPTSRGEADTPLSLSPQHGCLELATCSPSRKLQSRETASSVMVRGVKGDSERPSRPAAGWQSWSRTLRALRFSGVLPVGFPRCCNQASRTQWPRTAHVCYPSGGRTLNWGAGLCSFSQNVSSLFSAFRGHPRLLACDLPPLPPSSMPME